MSILLDSVLLSRGRDVIRMAELMYSIHCTLVAPRAVSSHSLESFHWRELLLFVCCNLSEFISCAQISLLGSNTTMADVVA